MPCSMDCQVILECYNFQCYLQYTFLSFFNLNITPYLLFYSLANTKNDLLLPT